MRAERSDAVEGSGAAECAVCCASSRPQRRPQRGLRLAREGDVKLPNRGLLEIRPGHNRRIRRLRGKGATGLIIWDDGEVTLDLRVRYPPAPGAAHFPDWRALLGRYLRYSAGMPGKSWAYNTEYLGRFAAARRDNTALAVVPLRIPSPYGHAPGSATVVLGPDFAGAVMGVRNDGDGDAPETLRRWRELIPEGSKP